MIPIEQKMQQATLLSGILLLLNAVLYLTSPSTLLLGLTITFLVTLYQLGMRLIVGNLIEPHLKINPNNSWFRVGKREQHLYRLIKVKRWKKFLPTYSPAKYDPHQHSLTDLIQTMCLAEVDHEIMFAFSYLPIILIILFGDPVIFISSSVIVSLIEIPFIILQRFNRQRLVAIKHRKERTMKKWH